MPLWRTAPRILSGLLDWGTLIKLGTWFEDIDYTALTHEEWIRHRVRVRLFRSYHRGNDILLHMRELEWRKTVFATKRELPHLCQQEGCDEHYWTHATCYNGLGVDSETLTAVYGLDGARDGLVHPRKRNSVAGKCPGSGYMNGGSNNDG